MTATTSPTPERILIVLTSHNQLGSTGKPTGFWLSELTHPYYVLQDAGYHIDIVSIQGGEAPVDPGSIDKDDPVNTRYFADSTLQEKVQKTVALSTITGTEHQAILFSGGHGTMWDFSGDININRVAANIYENNGLVAAVCHGPAALTEIRLSTGKTLIDGKNISLFTNEEEEIVQLTEVVPFSLEDELQKRGAKIVKGDPWVSTVSVDSRIITGQNPQSAHEVGVEMVALLDKSS